MPRARISPRGIEVAKAGYDVDTAAPANMMFSSSLVAMRLALTDIVTPVAYSGAWSAVYKRAIVNYATAFPQPPVVLVAGINNDGSSDQAPYVISGADGSKGWNYPYFAVYSYTNRFELFVYSNPASGWYVGSPRWRYFVFQNVLTAD